MFQKPSIAPWSGTTWQAVTPNDSVNLSFVPRGVVIGTSGDLRMADSNGTVVTFPSMAAGLVHPLSPTRIYATGTTAVGIVIII